MRKIYILYSCNEWKNHDSMRLVMASTNKRKIRAEIKRQVKAKNMRYGSYKEDLNNHSLEEINKCLEYGDIEIVNDGEKQ